MRTHLAFACASTYCDAFHFVDDERLSWHAIDDARHTASDENLGDWLLGTVFGGPLIGTQIGGPIGEFGDGNDELQLAEPELIQNEIDPSLEVSWAQPADHIESSNAWHVL